MNSNINQPELDVFKENFIAGITQILKDQKDLEEEHAKLVDAVNQSKQVNESKNVVVKLEDLWNITNISDELSRRKDELEERARKLFHVVTPSDIVVSQEFFDAWIQVSETMFVRFDYMEDRLVVRGVEETA